MENKSKYNRNSNFGTKWCNNKEFSFKCNFFGKAYVLDSLNLNFNPERDLDITKSGAQIIIADGTENIVDGANQEEKNGAIHSEVSILITVENKGDGILNVIGSSEGIKTKKNLFFLLEVF